MLRSLSDALFVLPLSDRCLILGRNRASRVKDLNCSRMQVQISFDVKSGVADVLALGRHPCVAANVILYNGQRATLQAGQVLQLLRGKHMFRLEVVGTGRPLVQRSLDFYFASKREANAAMQLNKRWLFCGTLIIFTYGDVAYSQKVAAFDLDNTIIKTRSGRIFGKDCNDWQFFSANVVSKLRALHSEQFRIVIFTNQRGLSSEKHFTLADFQVKIESIARAVGLPLTIFVSIAEDVYRKPRIGMWNRFCQVENGGTDVKLDQCFYVGDAAGRMAGNGKYADHSFVDRFFATNINVTFATPEVYFDKSTDCPVGRLPFDPGALLEIGKGTELLEPDDASLASGDQLEMIVMVGYPGSGKSHFLKSYATTFERYTIVHHEGKDFKSAQQFQTSIVNALRAGRSVIVDDVNADKTTRKMLIELARREKVDCRCFLMNVDYKQSKHNLFYRHMLCGDDGRDTAYDALLKHFEANYAPPTIDEGFSSVVKVNFKPSFDDTRGEQMYRMHLVD